MQGPFQLIVFSDSHSQRNELLTYIENHPEISAAAAFPMRWDPLEIVEQHRPSIVLLCPAQNDCIEFNQLIVQITRQTESAVLVLLVQEKPRQLTELILSGASGFIFHVEWQERLGQCIQNLLHFGISVSPSIAKKIFDFLRNPIVTDKSKCLTKKELQVLKEVRNGLSYKGLAEHFNIGESTVRTHCKSIYRKLGVRTRIAAINTVFLNPGAFSAQLNPS